MAVDLDVLNDETKKNVGRKTSSDYSGIIKKSSREDITGLEKAESLVALARLEYEWGDSDKAKETIEEANDYLGSVINIESARIMIKLGALNFLMEDFDSAVENYESAIFCYSTSIKTGFDVEKSTSGLSYCHRKISELETARGYFDKAIQELEKSKAHRHKGAKDKVKYLLHKGDINYTKGDSLTALLLYDQALNSLDYTDETHQRDITLIHLRKAATHFKSGSSAEDIESTLERFRNGVVTYSNHGDTAILRRGQLEGCKDLFDYVDKEMRKRSIKIRGWEYVQIRFDSEQDRRIELV